MNKTELRSLIREEVRKIINTKKTVKTSLQEGYSWERIPGKPLPTLEDVQEAFRKKKSIKESASVDYFKIVKDINKKYSSKIYEDEINDFIDWLTSNPSGKQVAKDITNGGDILTAFESWTKLDENYHNNDLQSTQKGKYDLQTEESEDDDWYGTKEKGEKDLDSSKGGTDNSLNAIHSSLLKIQKSMDALLSDYKSGKITKDVYIAKRKPLQAKRNKLEAAL